MGGACSSPDGSTLIISSVPSGYAWLDANGYCYSIGPEMNFTMCFTFTSTGTDVSLNSGYSSAGCFSTTFSGFSLYTCSPACTLVGTGLTFSGLTAGQCYTWCFSGTCGGFGPGFTSICPYWENTTPMPIELISFTGAVSGGKNILNWKCATEVNNDYFSVERSVDGAVFQQIGKVKGAGNSMVPTSYTYADATFDKTANYYRIRQVDFNGNGKYYNIVELDDEGATAPILVSRINVLGQEVQDGYLGIYIEIYNDGTRIKKCCDPEN
jgi:hypothetical protein